MVAFSKYLSHSETLLGRAAKPCSLMWEVQLKQLSIIAWIQSSDPNPNNHSPHTHHKLHSLSRQVCSQAVTLMFLWSTSNRVIRDKWGSPQSTVQILEGLSQIYQYNTPGTGCRDSGSYFYLWKQFPNIGSQVTSFHISFSASSTRMVMCGHLYSKGRSRLVL